MQSRTCPHCKAVIPLATGFCYDDKMNIICQACKKVIVAADRVTENRSRYATY